MSIQFKVSSYNDGDFMDRKYTCKGEGISPEITWSDLPTGTRSLALIMEDPDAPIGTFTHWVVYNIAPSITGLKENMPKIPKLENGITQGRGGLGRVGYIGPCPPGKKPHRYVFHFYATQLAPNLGEGLRKKELLKILEGNVTGEATFTLKYGRSEG